MRKSLWGGVAAMLLVAASPLYATAGGTARGRPTGSARYIVVLSNGVAHPGSIASRHARTIDAEPTHVYRSALKGYAARMSPTAAESLADTPNVAWVERDRPVSTAAQTKPTGGSGRRRLRVAHAPQSSLGEAQNPDAALFSVEGTGCVDSVFACQAHEQIGNDVALGADDDCAAVCP